MPNIALIEGNKLSDSGSDLTAISGQSYARLHSGRDFPNGTLIETTIDYSVTNGEPWVLEITGNSYGSLVPFNLTYQGYIYNNTTINVGGISVGTNITGMSLFNYNGKLCFWFPYLSYWQGFNVYVYTALSGRKENRVTAITNVAKPAGITKEVSMTFQQVVRTSSSTVGTTNYVSKFSANNVLTDSQIFDNGTNVGIGSSSPIAKLTVKGATNFNVNIGLLGGYAGVFATNDANSAYTQLRVDASTLMLNTYSAGNVGINTASPAGKLDVVGASTYLGIGSSSDTFLFLRGYNNGLTRIQNNSGFSSAYNGLSLNTNYTNANSLPSWNFDFGGQDGPNYLADSFTIWRKPSGGSYSNYFTINSSGNTGIGTSSPTAPLHIIKTGGSVSSINVGLIVDFEATAAEQTGAGTAIQFRGKSGGGNIANYNQAQIATNNVGSNNSHGLSFYYKPDAASALTEGFRLHPNGFVGIGTASPVSNLQVGDTGTAGNRTIRITDSGYGLLLSGGNGPANNYIQSLGTAIPLYFLSGNANNGNYVFSSTGRMGIGSTSPGGKVHIKQAASEIPLLIDSSAGTNAAYTQYLVGASAGWEVGMAGSGDSFKWFFSYGGFGSANAKVAITSGGNFGIGTSSPTFVTGGGLHVKMAGDSNIRITSGSYTGFDLVQAADGVVYLYNRDNTPFVFGTNNTERLRIAANGAVTIYNATTVSTLAGTGTRMVVADSTGLLSTQDIPSGGGGSGTVTSVALAVNGSGNDISVSGSPITTSGTFTLSIPDASATARGVVNTGTQTFAGNKTFTGQTSLNVLRTTINDGSFAMYMLATYNLAAGDTNKNVYATVDALKLNFNSGALTGGESYNVTANLNQVSIEGNATTISTQPIRGVLSGLVGAPGGTTMNIADFRHFDVKIPDRASLSGHIVTSIYGLKIAQLRGATGYTITNGWGVYQEGSQDNNYFNGQVLIGTNVVGSYKLDVNGDARFSVSATPLVIDSIVNSAVSGSAVTSVYSTASSSTIAFGSQANDTYLVGGFVFIGNQSAKFIVQADTLTGGYDGWGSIGSSAKYMKEVYTNYLVQKQVFSRQTASYTLVSGDRSKVIEMNVGSANTVTVPTNASVAFPIGTQITIIQYGAGQTTIAGSGVTFRSTNNWLKINAQYGSATIIKVGTDEWYVVGNLSA